MDVMFMELVIIWWQKRDTKRSIVCTKKDIQ